MGTILYAFGFVEGDLGFDTGAFMNTPVGQTFKHFRHSSGFVHFL
jgi:hypothetical protein